MSHEMRDDLGVRLGGEDGAHVGQAPLERHVVLHDPVDDDVDAVRRVGVRVGVRLVDAAVRRPAGVPDAGRRLALGDGHTALVAGSVHRGGHRAAQVLEVADRRTESMCPSAMTEIPAES
jgi:hypothetical protein